MPQKLNEQIKNGIYSRYLELLSQNRFKKGLIQEKLMREFDLPSSTCWDNSVGRLKTRRLEDDSDGEGDSWAQPIKSDVTKEITVEAPQAVEWQPKVASMPTLDYEKSKEIKNFLISGWELRVGVNENFIDCINQIASYYNADKYLVPVVSADIEYIPKIYKDNFNILETNKEFNENLIFHFVESNIFSQNPLTGWRGMFHSQSAILPSLTVEMITEPSMKKCKRLFTTGSIGYLNAKFDDLNIEGKDDKSIKNLYKRWDNLTAKTSAKAISQAQKIIRPSALLVQLIDNKIFLARYIWMTEEGIVYDLDKKFIAGQKEPVESNPEVMMTGDWHVYEMSQIASDKTLEMIDELKPNTVLLNDAWNGSSTNYHAVNSVAKFSSAPSIKEEVEVTSALLKEICDRAKNVVYLHSNHCNFLDRILDSEEKIWRLNGNYATLCGLQSYRLETKNPPIVKLLNLDQIDNLKFVHEKDFFVNKETTFIHGHNSFRPMGFRGLARIYGKLVTAHFHSPEISRGMAFCVGTNSKPDLDYSIGINSTMPCNAIQHSDGNIQLLDIIVDGEEGIWKN